MTNKLTNSVNKIRIQDGPHKGQLPHYAWPGAYRIFYMCADGGLLCSDCANGGNGSEASTDPDTPSDWRIEAYDVYWEGPDTYCDHCNKTIESEYGDPDSPDGDPEGDNSD